MAFYKHEMTDPEENGKLNSLETLFSKVSGVKNVS